MNKLISFFSTCLLVSVTHADPVTVPNTFSAGTPAKASEVNANFTALANAVNDAPKPLMVYDSTGKVIGRWLASQPIPTVNLGYYSLYGSKVSVLAEVSGLSFETSYSQTNISYTYCYSYCDPTTPQLSSFMVSWHGTAGCDPDQNTCAVVYKENNCQGQEYLLGGGSDEGPFNKSFIRKKANPSQLSIVGNTPEIITMLSWKYVGSGSGINLDSCYIYSGSGVLGNMIIGANYAVAPILGTVNMDTAGFTPRFYVH